MPLVSMACHDTGEVKVASLEFRGVHAVSGSKLKEVLATRASGWLPWSRKQYFDRSEFDADLKRITAFYADRGFPRARVTAVGVDMSPDRRSVDLSITIDEGRPIVVDHVTLTGFDVLGESDRDRLRGELTIKPGAPRDVDQLAAAKEAGRHMLRESGFAYATVDLKEGPAPQTDHVVIELAAVPGPRTVFGPVQIQGLKHIKGILVTRSMRFAPGEAYRESLVLASQRRLASLQVFDFVHVATEAPEGQQPAEIPTLVTVTESSPRRLEFGVGYGSEDKVRGSVDWHHLNLGGAGQHFKASGKWSGTLSGVAVGYQIPYPFRTVTSADTQLYAWWTDIPTYTSQSNGGTIDAVYRISPIGARRRENRKDIIIRAGYRFENQRYALTDQGVSDLSFSEKISLGFDPVTGRGSGTISSLRATVDRASVDQPLDPRRGYSGSLYLEHAAPWLGGTFRYDEGRFEARGYYPVGETVFAGRFQIGTITGTGVEAVPISERFFLGGTTVMRGWGRYELSPLSESGLPIGGRSQMAITLEMRRMFSKNWGAAVFVEGGNVWSGSGEFHPGSLRYDIGPGVRWRSPVGIVRADLGYQLTPIPGLTVDDQLVTRRWRVQISIGQAF
jgi:outer membrane protein insertion porin family/translocation and assembly module TamA